MGIILPCMGLNNPLDALTWCPITLYKLSSHVWNIPLLTFIWLNFYIFKEPLRCMVLCTCCLIIILACKTPHRAVLSFSLIINCREPRGFGFVQFVDPADAQEAKYQMDGQVLLGRQLTVVFAEENRKKPTDMRHREQR